MSPKAIGRENMAAVIEGVGFTRGSRARRGRTRRKGRRRRRSVAITPLLAGLELDDPSSG